MKKYYLLFLLVLLSNMLYGQNGLYILPRLFSYLTYQPSPLFLGAGEVGAAIPMKDPLGFYYNPAQLGYFSQNNNYALLTMPNKVVLPSYCDYPPFYSSAIAAGYNFNKKDSIPFSIGAGFLYSSFDHDDLYCLSLGAAYNYYLQFNFGFSIKRFSKKYYPDTKSGIAVDIGTMITIPVSKLLLNNIEFKLSEKSSLKPIVDITLGYSLTNLGDGIEGNDHFLYPIERTARLGYTLDFGVDLSGRETNINIIDYSFTAEAEDLLIKNFDGRNIEYHGIFGKIRPIKHLIKLDSEWSIILHSGNILRLFETLYITSGRYYEYGYNPDYRSYGYGFSSEGIFKLLSPAVDNSVIKYITDHIVVEYYDVYNYVGVRDTNFQGLAFYLKGI